VLVVAKEKMRREGFWWRLSKAEERKIGMRVVGEGGEGRVAMEVDGRLSSRGWWW
jgi:hypothetical protein